MTYEPFIGKVHGSMARNGKVRNQAPKVAKSERIKKMVMGNFGSEKMDVDVADAVDFMVEKVNCVKLLRKYCRVFGNKGSNL